MQRRYLLSERRRRNNMLEDYVVIDLEMTGLNPKTDEILEIGAVKVKDKKIEDTFSRLVCPRARLSEHIIELTGITNEMAVSGEEADTAMKAFGEFIEDLPWVGHNISFDYRFIKQWEVNHRVRQIRYAVDTLKIARKCLPHLEKKTLEYLCDYYAIEQKVSHRALGDAWKNRELYEILEANFCENSRELFVPKEMQCRMKRQTPATKPQKNYLKVLTEYHKIVLDVSVEQLTKSEASGLTDRIIRQYGKPQALASPEQRRTRP